MNLETLISKQNKAILKSEKKLITTIKKFEKKVYDLLLGLIDDLSIESGSFVPGAENETLLLNIRADLIFGVNLDELKESAAKVLDDGFNRVYRASKKIHKQASDFNIDQVEPQVFVSQELERESIISKIADSTVLVSLLIDPIIGTLFSAVSLGEGVRGVKAALKKMVIGGVFTKVAKQRVQDSFDQHAGAISRAATDKQVEAGIRFNAYRYVGSKIETTRAQCKRWINEFDGIIPFNEIESEIIWAETNGTGMIPGTTKETFQLNRGGHNCRHYAIPIIYKQLNNE